MGLNGDEREELRGLFNAVWSAVPDGPAYDARKWRRLSVLVDKAARESAPPREHGAGKNHGLQGCKRDGEADLGEQQDGGHLGG